MNVGLEDRRPIYSFTFPLLRMIHGQNQTENSKQGRGITGNRTIFHFEDTLGTLTWCP